MPLVKDEVSNSQNHLDKREEFGDNGKRAPNPSRKKHKRWLTYGLIASCLSLLIVGGGLTAFYIAQPNAFASDNANMRQDIQKKYRPKNKPIVSDPKLIKHARQKATYNENTSIGSIDQLEQFAKLNQAETLRGYVAVPSVGIQLPIYEGTGDHVLAIGSGTAKANQIMGKGNFTIAEHNFLDYRTGFSPLQNRSGDINITKNADVYLTDGKKIYQYQVKNWDKVPKNQSMPYVQDDPTYDKAQVTLYTCLEVGNVYHPTHRIIVQGDLVKSKPFNDWPDKTKALFPSLFKKTRTTGIVQVPSHKQQMEKQAGSKKVSKRFNNMQIAQTILKNHPMIYVAIATLAIVFYLIFIFI